MEKYEESFGLYNKWNSAIYDRLRIYSTLIRVNIKIKKYFMQISLSNKFLSNAILYLYKILDRFFLIVRTYQLTLI